MSTHTVLALAPDQLRTSQIARVLGEAGMTVCQGYSGQEAGRFIREHSIDAVVFAGEIPGLSAERILTAVADRLPQAAVIICLEDAAAANVYAERFRAHALPWPLQADAVKALIAVRAPATFLVPRRETRYRFLGGIFVETGQRRRPGLLLNISGHGAMVVSDVEAAPGTTVTARIPYGADEYALTATVRHNGEHADTAAALREAAWLPVSRATILGLEFHPSVLDKAAALCKRVRSERALLNLRVTCIPGVPKGLSPIFARHHVKVETLQALPEALDAMPAIVLIDISNCTLAELQRLTQLRRRSVVIGVATTPITDKERAAAAAKLPGVFVLPFQADTLARHIEEFFGPVDRKFPRIEEPFTVLLKLGGGVVAAEGVNLSLEGCAVLTDRELHAGAELQGTLAMDQALDAYPFTGRVVYCVKEGAGYRLGVHFALKASTVESYQRYLSSRFLKQLRQRWEEQLRSTPA